ncbi:MAG: hypothetical protein LBS54_04815 [Dysgonamonadaceae bacterium]|jgi:hypothetical protein|nr:hypothetical protein [Dysgonamonadaceae bacterium]
MKRIIVTLISMVVAVSGSFAQPSLKFSGYLQSQYQYGQEDAALKIGTANEHKGESFNRFGIRRGRIKLTAVDGIYSSVIQADLTEKGLGLKDAYLNVKDPWFGTLQVRGGVFDRPFGNEISYSSSRRESPERSTIFQTLFPEERDMGAMLVLQPAKTSAWNFLKLEAGLFAGNGIKQEIDSRRDFIGHLSAKTTKENFSFGGGISLYSGSVYQGTENVYRMKDGGFVVETDAGNKGSFAKREYFGADVQFSVETLAGFTSLRAEYLTGRQPGTLGSSKSPNAAALPTADTYLRDFSGFYVILVQDLGKLPFSIVFKYDYYDPNMDISGDDVGLGGTSKADLFSNTFGFGGLWKISNSFRLQAFYEVNGNETTVNLADRTGDIKDNVFTLRLQYKF